MRHPPARGCHCCRLPAARKPKATTRKFLHRAARHALQTGADVDVLHVVRSGLLPIVDLTGSHGGKWPRPERHGLVAGNLGIVDEQLPRSVFSHVIQSVSVLRITPCLVGAVTCHVFSLIDGEGIPEVPIEAGVTIDALITPVRLVFD